MAVIWGFLGIALVVVVAIDAFEVMLLPRRVRRNVRLVRTFFQATWAVWTRVVRRLPTERARDSFLSLYGPLSIVLLLSLWAATLIVGFGFLQYGLQSGMPHAPTLFSSIYFSGASFFTVGYGDIVPLTRVARTLAVLEAGMGLAFIAVTIGYLPVLYQLFSQREAKVILLDARAGSPPTAASLLCRHAEHEAWLELAAFLRDWEQWCAVVVESHLSYPMLSYYRSQHDNQSWLAALTAVLDASALLLTGFKGVRTFSARMTFAMGRLTAVELCRVFHIKVKTAFENRLPADDFVEMDFVLADAGLNFSERENAEQRLTAFRATYEPFLCALADHFLLRLPGWLPEEETDNWQRSSRGRTAGQLVQASPTQPE